MRAARSRTAVLAVAGLLLSTGCAARFARPSAAEQQQLTTNQGLTPDQGGAQPNGGPTPGAPQPGGTTGSTAPPITGRGTTGGTTGATTGGGSTGGTSGGSTGSTSGGPTQGPVAAGSKVGINGSTITIGLFVPKTGAAPVPPTVDAQVQNYFDYVKKKGGIWGRNVTVKVYDTGSTEKGARDAVLQAQSDGIFAAASLDRLTVESALVTALHKAGIPHLVTQAAPSTTIPDDAFYIGMNQLHHGKQIADYMAHVLKATKVGVITENDPGLYAPRDVFTSEAKQDGLQVVYSTAVDPGANEYLSQVQDLAKSGAQAVWLYMAPNVAINIAKESQSIQNHPTWIGNNISWGFNLAITPASGAFDGAVAFSPWGGLDDPRYATFRTVDTAGQTDKDQDIGLAGWGFGQIIAGALKAAGPDLGRNSFRAAMQNLRTGSTDVVTGAPMCWAPEDFTGDKRYGSGDRTIVLRVPAGGGPNAIWQTSSDYRSAF